MKNKELLSSPTGHARVHPVTDDVDGVNHEGERVECVNGATCKEERHFQLVVLVALLTTFPPL